jgi:hypothetical protein
MLEYWNDGIMEMTSVPPGIPSFQYSNIPFFLEH